MAWGDFLSGAFAEKLDDAGKVLMLVAWIAGAAGLFSGSTPVLAGAAVIGFAGLAVPPAYAVLACVARNVAGSQRDDARVADQEQRQATIEKRHARLDAECDSARFREMVLYGNRSWADIAAFECVAIASMFRNKTGESTACGRLLPSIPQFRGGGIVRT